MHRKRERSTSPTAILPAALLARRDLWQETVDSLPAGACLLVVNADNHRQRRYLLALARSLRAKGMPVRILSIALTGNHPLASLPVGQTSELTVIQKGKSCPDN